MIWLLKWQALHLLGEAITNCAPGNNSSSCNTSLPQVGLGSTNELQVILGILFGVLGVVSVLFVVIGALEMVTSDGNPESAAKARDTIIYALVGLMIAIAAEAIVGFVLGRL